MRDALRRFMTRDRVIEFTAAVAVGVALVNAVEAIVSGLIVQPIVSGANGRPFDASLSEGYFTLFNRTFAWLQPLAALGVLAAVLAIVGYVVDREREILADDRVAECPHCLSAIPEEAPVCCYCTRDVAPPAAA